MKGKKVLTHFEDLQADAYRISEANGFWEGVDLSDPNVVAAKIALMHSELSEGLEEIRAGHPPAQSRVENGKLEGLPSELADTVIRIMDFCGAYQIDLAEVIKQKMVYNKTRTRKHGKTI